MGFPRQEYWGCVPFMLELHHFLIAIIRYLYNKCSVNKISYMGLYILLLFITYNPQEKEMQKGKMAV